MEGYSRAQICLNTTKDVTEFVKTINSDGTVDKYVIEDVDGLHRVDGRSFLGVLYASSEFNGKMFLVNRTHDGHFPWTIDKFRPLGE